MQLTETLKLKPLRDSDTDKDQVSLIVRAQKEYIDTVNKIAAPAKDGVSIAKVTTAHVKADLPSALVNQCIRDACSVIKHYKRNIKETDRRNKRALKKNPKAKLKEATFPVLRKPYICVNNQNYRLRDGFLEFPVMINGRSTRIAVPVVMTERQAAIFAEAHHLGTMRIVMKNKRLVAQIVYEVVEPDILPGENIMGVDLGIKCPAVSYTSDGNIRFYGNGRKNKYMRRQFAYFRKKAQSAKKKSAVRRVHNKEERIMRDIDHKISREIVNTAIAHNVVLIKLECLDGIRSSTRRSRKNNKSLHGWSFYRLAQFIEYKARLAGTAVEYVNPAYTSQTCPHCGRRHKADDRHFVCTCGYHIHRDILGAMNIMRSTEPVGGSNARQAA